jgi:hypothetical protein
MRWAEHVAPREQMSNSYTILVGKSEEKLPLFVGNSEKMLMLKWILNK